MRSTLSLFVGLVALLLPVSLARAEAPRHAFQIEYVRGKGALMCPADGAAVLRQELVDVMHYDPVKPDAPQTASAIFERDEQGKLTGFAIMRDSAGKELWKTISISTVSPCRVLVQSVALAIVAALPDPKEPEPPPKPAEPPASPQPCPAAEPPRPCPAPATPPAAKPRNYEGYGGLDVMGSIGVTLTPSLGAGGFVGLRLREPALSVEVGGRSTGTLVASEIPRSNGRTAHARSTLSAGTLAACGRVHDLAFFCAIAGVGTMAFPSSSGLRATDRSSTFGFVGVRLGIQHALTKQLGLRYFAEIATLPGSADLLLNERVVWSKPNGMGAVGVGITFGPW